MLTVNPDERPLMNRFHKPDDEKRSVVIVPPTEYAVRCGAGVLSSDSIHLKRCTQSPVNFRFTNRRRGCGCSIRTTSVAVSMRKMKLFFA
jgi:hypothetical protein